MRSCGRRAIAPDPRLPRRRVHRLHPGSPILTLQPPPPTILLGCTSQIRRQFSTPLSFLAEKVEEIYGAINEVLEIVCEVDGFLLNVRQRILHAQYDGNVLSPELREQVEARDIGFGGPSPPII
ncbi:hypothetical protein ARMSODRAFT_1013447 [Armillaria solidipes]|uniref:Uncharacterized protein n=1 Tax=Armillaria solidipes TaxID=1076256 RepID=A0A2H3C2E8_9AGAR|nr:hypothetical protein ARMSODRAFT_1013447 [Armillaria solidipes]